MANPALPPAIAWKKPIVQANLDYAKKQVPVDRDLVRRYQDKLDVLKNPRAADGDDAWHRYARFPAGFAPRAAAHVESLMPPITTLDRTAFSAASRKVANPTLYVVLRTC